MQYKFIISRYLENIDWIREHDYIFYNSVIYNKGDKIFGFPDIINSENDFTREGGNIVKYIIDNYYNLPEYVFFVQANPFDHSPDFLPIVHYLTSHDIFKPYQPLTAYWKEECQIPPTNHILLNKSNYVANYRVYMECIGSNLLPIFYKDTYGIENFLYNFRKFYGINNDNESLIFLYNKFNLEGIKPYTGFTYFNYGAMFGVRREKINFYSMDFYINLQNFIHENKYNVYVMERLWYTIFG